MPNPTDIMLKASGITKRFSGNGASNDQHVALENVSLEVSRGEIVGLVGESGCGKTTLSRILLGLLPADEGEVCFEDVPLPAMDRSQFRSFRCRARKIFQQPEACLNPGMTVEMLLTEVVRHLEGHVGDGHARRMQGLLQKLGLGAEHLKRYPAELSSGQKKRVSIARALISPPALLIADEPFAGIDASHQKAILGFLLDQQRRYTIGMLVISHDLDLIMSIVDRVLVMKSGCIVDRFKPSDLGTGSQRDDYTVELLQARTI